jgi:hypothetical protein
MLLDASHRPWIVGCLAAVAVSAVLYMLSIVNVWPGSPFALLYDPRGARAGSWLGLAYGTVGLGLMVFAGVLGLRRKVPTWRVGRATTWMKGHLWLGLLSYVLILFHGGFQLGGPLTVLLMVLFTVVVASGIYGFILQQYLPRLMLTRVPLETVYEQIDAVVRQLRDEADALVGAEAGAVTEAPVPDLERRGGGGLRRGTSPAALRTRAALAPAVSDATGMREIYLSEIQPYLSPENTPDARLAQPAMAAALFRHLRTLVPPALHETLRELESICDERRQLADQKRLHHWLHGWLLVHVPLSMALLLLSVVHAIISIRY